MRFLKKYSRAKYYDHTNSDLIIQMSQEWLDIIDYKRQTEHRDNDIFTTYDFQEANIKLQNYLPLLRITDCLESV
jgi:hypothetical protein